MFETLAIIGLAVVGVALAIWWGTRQLVPEKMTGSIATSGIGVVAEVFDPGAHRSRLELDAQKERVKVAPSPDDDDRPVLVDLQARTAKVRPGRIQ